MSLSLTDLDVRAVATPAELGCASFPVGPEGEPLGTARTTGRTAVRNEAGPRQRAVHLYR